MFGCFAFISVKISLKLVTGNPFFSFSSFSFFNATISPVCRSRARYTMPYDPSSIRFKRSYSSTCRHAVRNGGCVNAGRGGGRRTARAGCCCWEGLGDAAMLDREGVASLCFFCFFFGVSFRFRSCRSSSSSSDSHLDFRIAGVVDIIVCVLEVVAAGFDSEGIVKLSSRSSSGGRHRIEQWLCHHPLYPFSLSHVHVLVLQCNSLSLNTEIICPKLSIYKRRKKETLMDVNAFCFSSLLPYLHSTSPSSSCVKDFCLSSLHSLLLSRQLSDKAATVVLPIQAACPNAVSTFSTIWIHRPGR